MRQRTYGFTIVELLIVIVVIAILAAISMVAYTNFQGKARDAQRISDIKSIERALEVYKVQNGHYPPHLATTDGGGWELSAGDSFIQNLASNGEITDIPVDPTNIHLSTSVSRNSDNWVYFYHRYAVGTNSMDASCGAYYVLGATRFDTIAHGQSHPDSPGFTSPGRTWVGSGAYVTGSCTN